MFTKTCEVYGNPDGTDACQTTAQSAIRARTHNLTRIPRAADAFGECTCVCMRHEFNARAAFLLCYNLILWFRDYTFFFSNQQRLCSRASH
jgi:hypothetical protein